MVSVLSIDRVGRETAVCKASSPMVFLFGVGVGGRGSGCLSRVIAGYPTLVYPHSE